MYDKQDLHKESKAASEAQAGSSEEKSEAKQSLTASAKGRMELPRTAGGIFPSDSCLGQTSKSPTSRGSAGIVTGLCSPGPCGPTAEPGRAPWAELLGDYTQTHCKGV